jgi:hypothetical protein
VSANESDEDPDGKIGDDEVEPGASGADIPA